MSENPKTTLEHASCVSIDGKGVLIRGGSGAGKSDLALRLIDGGGHLVADDYVELSNDGGVLMARSPERIAGRMEVRGLGLMELPCQSDIQIKLVVDLVPQSDEERLPDETSTVMEGIEIALCRLWGFAASAPAKVRLALQRAATSENMS